MGEYLGSITKTAKTKTTEQNRMGSYNLAYKSNYTNSTNNTDNEKQCSRNIVLILDRV